MGQKVHPIGFRVGVTRKQDSRWYANKKNFGRFLVEDHKIRGHIKKVLGFAGIPKIEIERTEDEIEIVIHAARPGVVIGRRGAEVDKVRDDIAAITGSSKVNIRIQEVHKPELSARLVAEGIVEQLEKRTNTRRAMKKAMETCVAAGVLGMKIQCSGRLGGAEIARQEKARIGSVPCQKLNADVDFGIAEASTTMGRIGVKVWLYKGDFAESMEEVTDGAHA